MKVKLNKKYKVLFTSPSRYFICTGGRGSSKSFSITTWVLLLMLAESGHTILFLRYTMTSAHISIIPEFLEKIELLGVSSYFNITKDSIECKSTGSKIIFKGVRTSTGDNTAALKSLNGVTTLIMDEAEELTDEKIFDKINLSIRQKGRQNRVILILNPTTKEHFIYNRFFKDNGVEPGSNITKNNITYIHTTYIDNIKYLDNSFIEEVEVIKNTNIVKFNHTILGGWLDKAEGVVITNWEIGEFNPNNLQTFFGQDFGFSVDPTTLVECAIDKVQKKIYVKEHLYKKGMTTSDIFEINNLVAGRSLIVADSAEPRLIEELYQRGNNIIPVEKGAGSISAGIAILQDYKIIVEENSQNIMKELNNYVYSNKKAQLFVDKDNHIIDAIRYAIYNESQGGDGVYHF